MNRRLTTQRMTRLALLAAAAVVLGYMENLISAVMLLPPGIKLGLANTVLLYSIYGVLGDPDDIKGSAHRVHVGQPGRGFPL